MKGRGVGPGGSRLPTHCSFRNCTIKRNVTRATKNSLIPNILLPLPLSSGTGQTCWSSQAELSLCWSPNSSQGAFNPPMSPTSCFVSLPSDPPSHWSLEICQAQVYLSRLLYHIPRPRQPNHSHQTLTFELQTTAASSSLKSRVDWRDLSV